MPQKTPLHAVHERLHANLTIFHGWLLPLYYRTPMAEHNAVRQQAGLFDISHMGIVELEGKDSEKLLQLLLVRDIAAMEPGELRLAVMCNAKGGILDDLTVYKFSGEKFWLVVNAAPYEKDLRQVQENAKEMDVKVTGLREQMAKLCLQGPESEKIFQKLVESNLEKLEYYSFWEIKLGQIECVVSRSGYTGEDGFELYFAAECAEEMWNALMQAGSGFNLQPCGLAARNTLRLEAGMLLHGQDIDAKHSLLECHYEKIVGWDKEFIGKRALLKKREQGVKEKLVGFELLERGIARNGCRLLKEGREVGIVTSGSFSPTLKKSIGLGYIGREFSSAGTEFEIEIRGKTVKAKVAKLPFYRRGD